MRGEGSSGEESIGAEDVVGNGAQRGGELEGGDYHRDVLGPVGGLELVLYRLRRASDSLSNTRSG